MIAVVNTTPIISLASINHLHLFKLIFGKIVIAEAVYAEIRAKQSYGYREVESDIIEVKSIKGHLYKDFLLQDLDLGEAETIILAKELSADFVLIDENLGYKIARNSGLTVIRTLSILSRAKERGFISEIKPLLDELINKGRWYSKAVYQDCLCQAGEAE